MINKVTLSAAEPRLTWIDLYQATADEIEQLRTQYPTLEQHLHSTDPEQLPKYETDEANQCWLMVLRLYAQQPAEQAHSIHELTDKLTLVFDQQTLLTVHKKPIVCIEKWQQKNYPHTQILSITDLVSRIIAGMVQSFEQPALQLTDEIDQFEDAIFLNQQMPVPLANLYYLKRRASVCKMILVMTQDVLTKQKMLTKDRRIAHDTKDQYLKLMTMFDQAQEDVENLLNIYWSLSAQKNNDVVRLLTIFSVFFMPLTFIAGVYGMNFKNMPELYTKNGYFVVWGVMVVVALAIWFWFKRIKIL